MVKLFLSLLALMFATDITGSFLNAEPISPVIWFAVAYLLVYVTEKRNMED